MRRLFAGVLLLLWVAAAAAVAQDAISKTVYERWDQVAAQAEHTLAETDPSEAILTNLRKVIADYRAKFQDGQSINADRIKTVQEQIDALGPPPADGKTEAPDVATKRKDLTDQLTKLRAPVLAAETAYGRANGLIREIDNAIRARQAARLVRHGPIPADPKNWVRAFSDLSRVAGAIGQEVVDGVTSSRTRNAAIQNLPVIIALILVAGLLLGYTGALARRSARYVVDHVPPKLREIGLLGVSLLRIVLPIMGLWALVQALSQSGLFGLRGSYLVEALPYVGAYLAVGAWLAAEAFPPGPRGPAAIDLAPEEYPGGRLAVYLTAFAFALQAVGGRLDRFNEFAPETLAVLNVIPLVLASFGLWQMSRKLRSAVLRQQANESHQSASSIMLAIRAVTWRASAVIAWVAPLIGLAGYMSAAQAMVYPMATTLALILAVRILQALVGDLYVIVARADEEARDGLVPVLLNLVLAMVSIPLLALIWGARWADLGEIWGQISGGFTVGGSKISILDLVSLIVVFTAGYIATRALQATLRISVLPKTKIDAGAANALVSGIGYVGIFFAGLIAITTTGIDLSSLAIVAGALSVGIGFGLQNIVSNFVSGIILLIERPITEGDWIEVGGHTGIVKAISVRSTRIETFDRTDVIVPNQDFVSGTVTNWTRGNRLGRVTLKVGVAYGTDTRKVERLLTEIAEGYEHTLPFPKPQVVFEGFGADSLDFVMRVFLNDIFLILQVTSELNHQIAERFREEGIEIPFAQRDIWLRNPEALQPRLAQPQAGTPASGRAPVHELPRHEDTDEAPDQPEDT